MFLALLVLLTPPSLDTLPAGADAPQFGPNLLVENRTINGKPQKFLTAADGTYAMWAIDSIDWKTGFTWFEPCESEPIQINFLSEDFDIQSLVLICDSGQVSLRHDRASSTALATQLTRISFIKSGDTLSIMCNEVELGRGFYRIVRTEGLTITVRPGTLINGIQLSDK